MRSGLSIRMVPDFIPRRRTIQKTLLNLRQRIDKPGADKSHVPDPDSYTIQEINEDPETPTPVVLNTQKSALSKIISVGELKDENEIEKAGAMAVAQDREPVEEPIVEVE